MKNNMTPSLPQTPHPNFPTHFQCIKFLSFKVQFPERVPISAGPPHTSGAVSTGCQQSKRTKPQGIITAHSCRAVPLDETQESCSNSRIHENFVSFWKTQLCWNQPLREWALFSRLQALKVLIWFGLSFPHISSSFLYLSHPLIWLLTQNKSTETAFVNITIACLLTNSVAMLP